MSHTTRRPVFVIAVLALAVTLIGAAQAPSLKGAFFKASNGTNEIGLDFDSTGALNVSVDGQAFSQGTWRVTADTVDFGPVTGPEGYGCTDGARYLWSVKDNTITFTRLNDDCPIRSESLTSLVWTRG